MEKTSIAEDLPKNISEYINVQYEIHKLKIADKAASGLATVITIMVISVIALFTAIFTSIYAAIRLSDFYNSVPKGFLIVAAFYAGLLVLLILFRKTLLINRIRNTFIRNFLS